MNQQEIIGRIKYLIKELNYRQADFARKIDVDTSNLSKYLNGRLPLSESLINRIVVNMGVSKQWLEEGTDLPFAKPIVPSIQLTPTIVQDTHHGTPVYDIDVTAGAIPRSQMFTDEQIVGWIDLPEIAGSDHRIVRVNGDSMQPVICHGDYIALRELTSMQYIYWGQIYVVILDDFRMIKYVRKNVDPNKVTLRSANPEYDDMDIYRNDIRDMMLVQQILHIDTRL
ncbi:MAG: helix-turn-helix transcriptional regulator [Muribaculaceae bacterium]|nr:helix-turn-helix transcriptional regulator [Muribaculaceae bacterium]